MYASSRVFVQRPHNFAQTFPIILGMDTSAKNTQVEPLCKIAGFTLLEVLAALSIVSISLVTAASSLATYQRKSKLSRTASSLRLLVERTYSHALATRQEITLVVKPTAAVSLTRAGDTLERLPIRAPIEPLLKDTAAQELNFYPSISASPATITLRSGAHVCQVVVSLRGRTRTVCD